MKPETTSTPATTNDATVASTTSTDAVAKTVKVKAAKKLVVVKKNAKAKVEVPAKKVPVAKTKVVPAAKTPAKKTPIAKVPAKKVPAAKTKVPAKKTPAAKTKVVPAKKAKTNFSAKKKRTADNFDRNFGRVKFNGETLSKGRAVHAVVAAFNEKKKPTLSQLKDAFPDTLLKNYGVVQEIAKAKKYSVNGKTRYFVGNDDLIKTKDGKSIAVCNQFSTENIKPLIKHAKSLGFTLTPVSK